MKGRITRRTKRFALCALLLAYAAFAATGCGADRLILGENHQTLDTAGLERRSLKLEGRDVEYFVTRSPGAAGREPAAFVLYFTGKGSLAERWVGPVAESWADRPIEMWAMNYPGSGNSTGGASLARVAPSALAVYDALKQTAGDRPIFVQGGSFGTTAALGVAARRTVAGLVLKNPPALRELILGTYGWWNVWLLAYPISRAIPADLDSVANAARCTAPALFLSAGADAKVPPRYHEMIIAAYAGPKQVIRIPGAGHDDPLASTAAAEFATALDHLWQVAALPGLGAVPATSAPVSAPARR